MEYKKGYLYLQTYDDESLEVVVQCLDADMKKFRDVYFVRGDEGKLELAPRWDLGNLITPSTLTEIGPPEKYPEHFI